MFHSCRWLVACLLALVSAAPALARLDDPLISRITMSVLQQAFPGA